MKALGLLMSIGVVHPLAAGAAAADADGAKRFNRALVERLTPENAPNFLAAPAIGAGVRVDFADLLGLSAAGGDDADRQALPRRSWEMMSAAGKRLFKDGEPLEQAAHEAEMAGCLKIFETDKLPLFQRLGVV